jgi:hypothetical protein
MTWNQERFRTQFYIPGSLTVPLVTMSTLDRQPRPCELQACLDEEAGQQEDSMGGQGLQEALASTVGALHTTPVSAHNLIVFALQKSALSPPSTHATSHATCVHTSQHIPVDE